MSERRVAQKALLVVVALLLFFSLFIGFLLSEMDRVVTSFKKQLDASEQTITALESKLGIISVNLEKTTDLIVSLEFENKEIKNWSSGVSVLVQKHGNEKPVLAFTDKAREAQFLNLTEGLYEIRVMLLECLESPPRLAVDTTQKATIRITLRCKF